MTDLAIILAGLALLYFGGDRLVDDATDVARGLGVSPLVVGLTVVAFSTSMPELAASLAAVLDGAPGIAVGNVVGSNIANLGLILGATALIVPLKARARFLVREMPALVVASVAALAILVDGRLERVEAALLLAGLAAFLVWVLRRPPTEPGLVRGEYEEEYGEPPKRLVLSVAGVALGVALLVLGARFLVHGAVGIARDAGVSERVIGLTLVALGTSLPELAGSIAAALKGKPDIALGNLVGSNLFNLLFILGATAAVRPLAVEAGPVTIDLAVMLGFTLVAWPFLWSRHTVGRLEGATLVAGYGVYVARLFA